MSLLRPLVPADHQAVLALNERNVELLAPLDEARLVQLVAWAETAAALDVDGTFAGFVLTFGAGSPYDGENFAWFSERYPDFTYLDRVVIHEDFRRRGLGTREAKRPVARDDDAPPSGQRAADRIPRLSAHDHRRAERELLEAPQVLRQMHEKLSAMADAAVAGDDGDEADERVRHGGDCLLGGPR